MQSTSQPTRHCACVFRLSFLSLCHQKGHNFQIFDRVHFVRVCVHVSEFKIGRRRKSPVQPNMWPAFVVAFPMLPLRMRQMCVCAHIIFIQLNSTAQIYFTWYHLSVLLTFLSIHGRATLHLSQPRSIQKLHPTKQKLKLQFEENENEDQKKKKDKQAEEWSYLDIQTKMNRCASRIKEWWHWSNLRIKSMSACVSFLFDFFPFWLASMRLSFLLYVRLRKHRFQIHLFPIYLFGSSYWSTKWKKRDLNGSFQASPFEQTREMDRIRITEFKQIKWQFWKTPDSL